MPILQWLRRHVVFSLLVFYLALGFAFGDIFLDAPALKSLIFGETTGQPRPEPVRPGPVGKKVTESTGEAPAGASSEPPNRGSAPDRSGGGAEARRDGAVVRSVVSSGGTTPDNHQTGLNRQSADRAEAGLPPLAWNAFGGQAGEVEGYRFRPLEEEAAPEPQGGDDFSLRVEEARRAYWNGNLESSVARYRNLIGLYPDVASLYAELGNVYYKANKLSEAGDSYVRAAILFSEQGNIPQAEQLLGTIRELRPPGTDLLEYRLSKEGTQASSRTGEFP